MTEQHPAQGEEERQRQLADTFAAWHDERTHISPLADLAAEQED